MKVKLKQHYQDARIHLEPGQVYEGELSAYLLKHRMAEEVKEPEKIEVTTYSDPEPVYIEGVTSETPGEYGKLPDFDPATERVAVPKRKRGKQ